MRPHKIAAIMLLLLTTIQLNAQDTLRLSLRESLRYAEKNQVAIRNALLDQQISLARNKEVTGLALPQLKANGGITHAPLVAAFMVPNFMKGAVAQFVQEDAINQDAFQDPSTNTLPLAFQPRWTTTAAAELTQILFDPSVMVALQARKALEELAQKGVELTVQDVKVAVSKAYYNLLIAERQRALVDQNIERLNQMEFEMEEMYKAGFVEKIDVDRIKVALNNLKTQKVRVDQSISLAYLALKYQMGLPLATPIRLTDSLSDDFTGAELLLQEFHYRNRFEYQLLEIQRELNEFDLKRYKLGWLPTLSAFGNYGYTLYNMEKLFQEGDEWQRTSMLGVNLSVPLFTGFQRKYQARQAELTLQKTQNDLIELRRSLNLQEENARITLRNNVMALGNQRENMELAASVYNTARIKYREGEGSSLEVMDAEAALTEAQTNYFVALYDVMTARVDLEKALGIIQ